MTQAADQTPDGWGRGADWYASAFAPFTGAFAADLVDLLDVAADDRVLDVAAGTGAFSRRAAARGASVLATDFSPDMLAALRVAADADGLAVETAVMDGQALDLPDAGRTVAASVFGVIFFPDTGAGLRELARVTRPSGRLGISSWSDDGPRLSRLVGAAVRAADLDVTLPPPAARAPLGTAAGCVDTLRAHGWRDVVVHERVHDLVVPEPEEFFRSMLRWSAPVRPIADLLDAAGTERAAEAFGTIVRDAAPTGDRVPFSAFVSIGAPA
jgi:SAM-dependent methyltransferase